MARDSSLIHEIYNTTAICILHEAYCCFVAIFSWPCMYSTEKTLVSVHIAVSAT